MTLHPSICPYEWEKKTLHGQGVYLSPLSASQVDQYGEFKSLKDEVKIIKKEKER